MLVVQDIEISDDILILHIGTAKRHRLVENRERVTHCPVSLAGDDVERLVINIDILLGRDVAQIPHYVRNADTVEIVGLAPGQDRRQNLVLLGGRQDENRMCRRSNVFRKALNADWVSMWTSSMIYTLYFPTCGGICTWSISVLMSSTPLLDAASSSWMQYERPSWKETQDSHWPQGSISAVGEEQLMVLAKMRAALVLPTPRGPQKR